MSFIDADIKRALNAGQVIPACPLALDKNRKLDERRQRALIRYYAQAKAGGIAVGVHTTQFAIHDPKVGLLQPVLDLVMEEALRQRENGLKIKIAGVCGNTSQAVSEAKLAHSLGYDAVLLSLTALSDASEDQLIDHCRAVAEISPIIGFYIQASVGGRRLAYSFWRRFAETENVVAIKIAPFNRYQTLDVVRAVCEAGRSDITLLTGNDDNIVMDLITPYRFKVGGRTVERRIVGGLLGHWTVWTKKAVELLDECHEAVRNQEVPVGLLRKHIEVTDCNAAFFDAANGFAGCIAGLHEVLRRQGLFEGIWCLDPKETLSPGQKEEIDRVYAAYPHLHDDAFVQEHIDEWLSG
ncbi:dihydrodipicolinate synthase family protein [bacterium]|nr:dihydrodipicolinate synthase family protein [bacterium]